MSAGDYDRTAGIYASVGIEDTYYLAFREVRKLFRQLVTGGIALDHGCGVGRSTKFLRDWGYNSIGADVDAAVLAEARVRDPTGSYIRTEGKELPFRANTFDLIFQSCVLVEYRHKEDIVTTLIDFRRILKPGAAVILVTANEEYYKREWKSFVPKHPSAKLQSGDVVSVALRGTTMVFQDTYWSAADYAEVFKDAGFYIASAGEALASGIEPFRWYSELEHSCWRIYLLKAEAHS